MSWEPPKPPPPPHPPGDKTWHGVPVWTWVISPFLIFVLAALILR